LIFVSYFLLRIGKCEVVDLTQNGTLLLAMCQKLSRRQSGAHSKLNDSFNDYMAFRFPHHRVTDSLLFMLIKFAAAEAREVFNCWVLAGSMILL
jgi:hypothetical protein